MLFICKRDSRITQKLIFFKIQFSFNGHFMMHLVLAPVPSVQGSAWEGRGGGRVHIWSPVDKGLTTQGWLGSVCHHKHDIFQLEQLLYSVSNVCHWRPVGQLMTIFKRWPFTSDLNYHQEKCILMYIFHLTLKQLVFSIVQTWKITKKYRWLIELQLLPVFKFLTRL